MRRDRWGPMWIGIRRKNRSLILRCCDTGEEIKEPEVDLSDFLARQRLDDTAGPTISKPTTEPDEDEVDHSLAHLKSIGPQSTHKSMKGRVQVIEWDEELENMSREKASADANRDLKSRFRTSAAKQPTNRSSARPSRTQNKGLTEAPPLPTEEHGPKKTEKQEMQDFLDDLLS
ncbi:hypothetical protein BDM02DRAFT_1895619 [Thelephora ganbajun]|uniref:Uncharacterized protein n=1 Tax=Thelephora ganbajun TaxID=370292 RepID=A0ACB6ZVJ8_THEGA|nr:hypothetical protein BDM02DRAFT_1895619 [Thelephora ganbajun]